MALKTRGSGSLYLLLSLFCLLVLLHLRNGGDQAQPHQPDSLLFNSETFTDNQPSKFNWARRVERHPVTSLVTIPEGTKSKLPRVQHRFSTESAEARWVRESRRNEIRKSFLRGWNSYREYAWMQDELTPISGIGRSAFGGWAATLVDALDTLWIMDLKKEFAEAVEATLTIDFTNTTSASISLFETNIRYLGGLLSAYDLSGDVRLVHKAAELGHTLYAAFDTPNRMPVASWYLHAAAAGLPQEAEEGVLSAELGSLSLEFTRLSQLTGDPKWYAAIDRISRLLAAQQDNTRVPGMWPIAFNARDLDFTTGNTFSIGAMADSLYEYLPKMYALLSGSDMYASMYNKAMDAAIEKLMFRPMVPDNADVLIVGSRMAKEAYSVDLELYPHGEHLACFVGGMLALGGRLLKNETHVEIGRKLTDGCVWTYENSELGIMPEGFNMVPCSDKDNCHWDEADWINAIDMAGFGQDAEAVVLANQKRLKRGFTEIQDRRYALRPEAIESIFILYRVTGDMEFREKGWKMWESIDKHTATYFANSALDDMTDPMAPKSDRMESFWFAETLKYFYLLYSPPSLISLDEYVLNTEAHPLRRPTAGWW